MTVCALHALQVRTAYGVLPPDHQQRTEVLLDSGVAMLQAGNASGCANTVLQPMMEQNEQVRKHCIIFVYLYFGIFHRSASPMIDFSKYAAACSVTEYASMQLLMCIKIKAVELTVFIDKTAAPDWE